MVGWMFGTICANIEDSHEMHAHHTHPYSKVQPGRAPSALNTMAAGQKPVKLAWIMLAPANIVR